MNQLEKYNAQTKSAYVSAANAIKKSLGSDATNERVLDVVMLMAHLLLTDNYQHPPTVALHNLEFFNKQLTDMIIESQKDIKTKNSGLFM
ncbi:MAG: hypothetical protein PHO08_14990 [Methylococcales bacterium]|nr:hypothetical protein [Methylococcales bacterium]